MRQYVIAIPERKETRNTETKHYEWLKANKIHFDKVKTTNRLTATCLLYQLRHAILFRDYVQKEFGNVVWAIMAVESYSKDNDPYTMYIKDGEMVAVPLTEIAEIRKVITQDCVT